MLSDFLGGDLEGRAASPPAPGPGGFVPVPQATGLTPATAASLPVLLSVPTKMGSAPSSGLKGAFPFRGGRRLCSVQAFLSREQELAGGC